MNSKYLVLARFVKFDFRKAVNKRYCVNWLKIPIATKYEIVRKDNLNVQSLDTKTREQTAATNENENIIPTSCLPSVPIFLIMISCKANKMAASKGQVYNRYDETYADKSTENADIDKKQMTAPNNCFRFALSLKNSLLKSSSSIEIVHKIVVTSINFK